MIWANQRNGDSRFIESEDGVLRRISPEDSTFRQIVVPLSLRPRLLNLEHHALISGHPGQRLMCAKLRRRFYWPQMAADVNITVRNCSECASNRLQLRNLTNSMKLFPTREPLVSIGIDILGPLPKAKSGKRFLLVITYRFSKMTQAIPLPRIDAYTVARAFAEEWVCNYGSPETVL